MDDVSSLITYTDTKLRPMFDASQNLDHLSGGFLGIRELCELY